MSRSDMLQAQRQQLEASACSELSDASSYLFFDDAGNVLAASFQASTCVYTVHTLIVPACACFTAFHMRCFGIGCCRVVSKL